MKTQQVQYDDDDHHHVQSNEISHRGVENGKSKKLF